MLLPSLLRTKSIESLQSESQSAGSFRRVLGLWQLTAIGLGGLIGAGIFVLTGVVAATQAGPGVALSFLIAGIASAAAALSYAEFSGMIPVAGSAYTYGYAVLGELVAWIIGWDLLLEYALVVAVVSIGWSAYAQSLLSQFGFALPLWARGAPGTGQGHVIDLMAVLGSLGVAGLLTLQIEWGARFNTLMVILKIAAVLLVIAAGLPHIQPANWHPFMPFGFGGVVNGAAVVFFAVFGYDTLTTAAEEARDPQRQLPRAVLLSLAISLVLYVAMALVLTGMVHYDRLNSAAPVAAAFSDVGLRWVALIVSVAAVIGLLERDARLHAGLRAHLVCDEPRRSAAVLVFESASALSHAASPDADRGGADGAGRRILSHSGSGGTRQHRHALGLRRDLPGGHRAAPDAARCAAHIPHAFRALHTDCGNRLFAVAVVKTPRHCLGALSHLDDFGPLPLFLLRPAPQQACAPSAAASKIIQETPKRSVSMPKRGEKKVFAKGIWILPPSTSAAKTLSASASLSSVSVSEMPSNVGLPLQRPSEAITICSPMRNCICMILFSQPGGTMPGCGGSGLSLKRSIIVFSAPSAF